MKVQSGATRTGAGLWATALAYVELTKPRSVFLLVFTALATMVVAQEVYGHLAPLQFTAALLAVTLACAGANAVSCYIDRDLDAAMERTRRRPIPAGKINPPARALYWGLLLFTSSLLLGWLLNPVAFACLWAGMLGYVGVYSLWLKRRSSWNIILGGFSGGVPALFGWAAVSGKIDLLPLLMAALVVLWIPNHIWSLAFFYREDYARVKVPMLPVVCEARKALHCLLSTVVLMVIFSLLIYLTGSWGYIYLATSLLTGAVSLGLSLHVYIHPSPQNAWRLFKFSSPYLFVLFLSMMLDVWF